MGKAVTPLVLRLQNAYPEGRMVISSFSLFRTGRSGGGTRVDEITKESFYHPLRYGVLQIIILLPNYLRISSKISAILDCLKLTIET
jgi:hypothetical protein